MSRGLSFSHVQRLLERVPDLRGSVLVGGQALNYWAGQYRITNYGQALSFDIDFLGGGAAAEEVALIIGGKVTLADIANPHSPNTALVTTEIDGVVHHIDFLSSLHGFSISELRRVKDWAIEVRPHGGGPTILVMHPVHCLESVLENTYGAALNRREGPAGVRAAERVRLAIDACRCMALEYLDQARERDALRIAEKVHAMSIGGPALRAQHEDDVDVTRAIPHERMPKAFIDRRWPQLQRVRAQAFARYLRRRD